MPKPAKSLSNFLALLLLLVLANPAWSVGVGETLPDFTLGTLDGKSFSRESLQGKPTVLVFWNTWCPNCREELPRLNRLVEELGEEKLAVYAINTSINDSEEKARAYWRKGNFGFSSGFDHGFALSEKFGIIGVPTVFLVDAGGVVRYKQPLLPQDVAERIRSYTSKSSPKPRGSIPLAGTGDPYSRSGRTP